MELVFLGTAHAVPTPDKSHSALWFNHEDENILIDCGEGTQRQIKKAHLNPCKLTKILISHWHGDHILGIPGLLQTMALNNYSKTLKIYGPRGTKRYMDLLLHMFIFVGSINIEVIELNNGKFFENKSIQISSQEVKHGKNALAYKIEEKDKININIEKLKKIGVKPGPHLKDLKEGRNIRFNKKIIRAKDYTTFRKGRKISIIMDTAYLESLAKFGKDSDIMIAESTYIQEDAKKAEEYDHLTASQAATIAKKAGAKQLYLTHISQRYEHNESIVLKEARKIFKNTILAKDFMKIKI
jgi:ribonuclease Z